MLQDQMKRLNRLVLLMTFFILEVKGFIASCQQLSVVIVVVSLSLSNVSQRISNAYCLFVSPLR